MRDRLSLLREKHIWKRKFERNRKMKKKLMMVVAGAVVACPCWAMVICSADSPATFVDLRSGVRCEVGTNAVHSLAYDASWIGDNASAEVAIAVDGAELWRGTGASATASGRMRPTGRMHSPTRPISEVLRKMKSIRRLSLALT